MKQRTKPSKYDWAERRGWIYDTGSSSTKAKVYGEINLSLACKLHKVTELEYLEEMDKFDQLTGRLLNYYIKLKAEKEFDE